MMVLIKGAGDLASGVAARLYRSGFRVVMTELPEPLLVRRGAAFGEAIYAGRAEVEGIVAVRTDGAGEGGAAAVAGILAAGEIPVLVDPEASAGGALRPGVLVDAIMAKRNTGTRLTDAPLVIALGPGFTAGSDCHAVIETQRGHWLGRVYRSGAALPDTGSPGESGGVTDERVLRAPADGVFAAAAAIGDPVAAGQVIGSVAGVPVTALCAGVLRGIVRDGIRVTRGLKVGDVDPRGKRAHCFTISDKSLAVAGGVLEAIVAWEARSRA